MSDMLATANDLAIWLTGEPSADPLWIARADLTLEMVSSDVQEAANNQIAAAAHDDLLAGTWRDDLELPNRPVTAVLSVALNGVALAAGEWAWNGGDTLRRGVSAAVDFGDLGSGAGGWGGPESKVRVRYDAGLAVIPPWVRGLVIRAAARQLGNPQGLKSESLGAYAVSYTAPAGGDVTITERERMRLRRNFTVTGSTIIAGR